MKASRRRVITNEAAMEVIDGCVSRATEMGVAVVVAVLDPAGHPVAFTRMDGSPMLSMPLPGGVPLVLDGELIGAVGVSGATGEQDHLIAEAGAGTIALESFTISRMESAVRGYFDACNSGDANRVAAFFTGEAVHYFPPGMYQGPFIGAQTIGRKWAEAVAELGSVWVVDSFVGDAHQGVAVIEWTHFKTRLGTVLRGDEWYRFDRDSGLISEIRAYYASPQAPDRDRLELGGFDYSARGYALRSPIDRSAR